MSRLGKDIWNESSAADTIAFKALIARATKEDLNFKDEDGYTPLMVAADKGHEDIVQILVDVGADKDLKNKYGRTALMMAVHEGHRGIAQLLISSGAKKDTLNLAGMTLLMIAAHGGRISIVEWLVNDGVYKDAQDMFGRTALWLAADRGDTDVLQFLISAGAEKNTQNNEGYTALRLAAEGGCAGVCSLLVDAGADKNLQDKDGNTALMVAARAGHREVARKLIDAGARTDLQNKVGMTALMCAARKNHKDVVQLLLADLPDLDIKDKFGRTALKMATDEGHTDVAQMLVEAGAVSDRKGKSAMDYARSILRSRSSSRSSTQTPSAALLAAVSFGRALMPASVDTSATTTSTLPVKADPSPPPTATLSSVQEVHGVARVSTSRPRYQALQQECDVLLERAALAVRHKELIVREEAIASRLAAAVAARDIGQIAVIRRERTEVQKERSALVLAQDEIDTLPGRIRELEDRFLSFSLECNDDTVEMVADLQRTIQHALRSLATSISPVCATATHGLKQTGGHLFFSGSIPITDVNPAFPVDSAGHTAASTARLMLRGRFETVDGLGRVYQYQCVIKCAAPAQSSTPLPDRVHALRREHEMYLEVQRLSRGRPSGCVDLYAADPKHHYLVLEDHGLDLRALLKPNLRAPQLVLEAVVSAVLALHSAGVMHGDIKPQNLVYKWVDHDYVVKLCDLDAAYKVGEKCPAACLGTEHYHAPELRDAVRADRPLLASLALDMFPLGLVMWQVLARSPHAPLDCNNKDELYECQDKLIAHLRYPPLYREALESVTSIRPEQRMNITDLYRTIKRLSASSAQQGWLYEKGENEQLKKELHSINGKLDKMDAKLDRVLQELRIRFDALGSSAVEIAESLHKEIILGSQQAQVLRDMIRATQDALQRLSSQEQQVQQSPAALSVEIQGCLSAMQEGIEAAVSRTLTKHRDTETGEFSALVHQMQNRFTDLSSELRAHLQDERQSSTHATQRFEVLGHTSECLKASLTDVLHNLNNVQEKLDALKSDQKALGKQVSLVLSGNEEMSEVLRTLTTTVHDMPTLAIVLPVVSDSWKNRLSPMRVVRDQYRLYFLCGHTHQIAPCGPKGKGYKITMTKQWVLDAAPVLRVGLVLVKVALLASGLPLPVPDLCSMLEGSAMHAQYLNAALDLVSNPPDSAVISAEHTIAQTLDAMEKQDLSGLRGTVADARLQEGSRKAYETIKEILGRENINIPLTCGLRQVTHRGKTAWVLDNDATEWDWRSHIDNAVLG